MGDKVQQDAADTTVDDELDAIDRAAQPEPDDTFDYDEDALASLTDEERAAFLEDAEDEADEAEDEADEAEDEADEAGEQPDPEEEARRAEADRLRGEQAATEQSLREKIKTLAELPTGAKFGIPNDPTNGGRALLLLQSHGLIKLKEGAGLKSTPLDVVSNPKKLKFVELDAAQLPRSLDDLEASTVNTNFAISAGLNPKKDAIALESAKNPYVNIMVVRDADKNQPWVAQLIKSYHSEEVRQFIEKEFKGSVFPAF